MADNKLKKKSGMVSIIGRPNVGKSTLLNTIVGEKVAIVSKVPQTTRNEIRGFYNDERGQIVFVDTPGVHKGRDKLDQHMNQTSSGSMDDVDCIIYLVDTTRDIGEEEHMVADRIKNAKCPVILGLNKVDMRGIDAQQYIEFYEEIKGEKIQDMKNFTMVALSGLKEKNVDTLIDTIFDYLPEGEALYPEDTVSDFPEKLAIADIIREKLFDSMKEEVPHDIGVFIEQMKKVKGKVTVINALIYVERPTQKQIVIGKTGNSLKEVGSKARQDIQALLDTKVFLELTVKVQKGWRDNLAILQECGYSR